MEPSKGLPPIKKVSLGAPFGWLAQGWRDLWSAPGPCLAYGLALAAFSFWLCRTIYLTNAAFWALSLTMGFVFVAPMVAMGLYEAGRRIELGERPSLGGMVFVRTAVRQDTCYLGLALLMIYLFWGRIAQIVYGLSTFQSHPTIASFITFALHTREGHTMLVVGSVIGAATAFLTFTMVVVSAPMLLDSRSDVFTATVTSFRAVAANTEALTLWALLIAILTLISMATGFAGLVVIFPWLGLASWRAYRALVTQTP